MVLRAALPSAVLLVLAVAVQPRWRELEAEIAVLLIGVALARVLGRELRRRLPVVATGGSSPFDAALRHVRPARPVRSARPVRPAGRRTLHRWWAGRRRSATPVGAALPRRVHTARWLLGAAAVDRAAAGDAVAAIVAAAPRSRAVGRADATDERLRDLDLLRRWAPDAAAGAPVPSSVQAVLTRPRLDAVLALVADAATPAGPTQPGAAR